MKKTLYWRLKLPDQDLIAPLDECMKWIEAEDFNEGDEVEFVLTPEWLTDRQISRIPEWGS